MTREELDFIGALNMCDEISNEAYKKIMCHCEEQDPCEDCISRNDIQDYIAKYLSQYLYNDVREAIDDIDVYIGDMPSVQPKTKIGRWIKSSDSYGNNHFTCSECGNDIATKAGDWEDNYCSNCGAKMEG